MRTPDPDTITGLRALIAVAQRGAAFDADDLRGELMLRGQIIHSNAIGAAFRLAKQLGLTEEMGRNRAEHVGARGRSIRLWRWKPGAKVPA